MKKPSLFKIGLILSIIGVVFVGYGFYEGEKISQTFLLDTEQTESLDLRLQDSGIGFYKISVPDLGDSVFIQIVDSQHNVLADKKIETKTAVNYFDFENSDVYTLKVTNLSDHQISVQIEFGDTNLSQIRYPGIVLYVGVILLMISGYRRLKNYKIAQPDENIS
ncbi:MAG: hypothetical protein NPMRth3_1770003 [Nitrosopumilales archaeon]|nr:MAG: hypothetical protein NPMRth3_1770003 [Nitrosopumilales archaeon]